MYQHNELQVQLTQLLSPFLCWASNTRLCSSSLPLWHLVRFQRWCTWRSSPQYILAKKRQVRFSRETFTTLTPCERKMVKAQKVGRYKETTRLWHFDSSLKSWSPESFLKPEAHTATTKADDDTCTLWSHPLHICSYWKNLSPSWVQLSTKCQNWQLTANPLHLLITFMLGAVGQVLQLYAVIILQNLLFWQVLLWNNRWLTLTALAWSVLTLAAFGWKIPTSAHIVNHMACTTSTK